MEIIPEKDKKEAGLFLRVVLWAVATILGGLIALLIIEILKSESVLYRWEEIAIAGIFIGAFSGILTENVLRAVYRFLRNL